MHVPLSCRAESDPERLLISGFQLAPKGNCVHSGTGYPCGVPHIRPVFLVQVGRPQDSIAGIWHSTLCLGLENSSASGGVVCFLLGVGYLVPLKIHWLLSD